jgi:small acid-soluble spore protein N (minor)
MTVKQWKKSIIRADRLDGEEARYMSNPRGNPKYFNPNHLGTQPRAAGGNKGKKMQDQSGQHAQVIQTKGE